VSVLILFLAFCIEMAVILTALVFFLNEIKRIRHEEKIDEEIEIKLSFRNGFYGRIKRTRCKDHQTPPSNIETDE